MWLRSGVSRGGLSEKWKEEREVSLSRKPGRSVQRKLHMQRPQGRHIPGAGKIQKRDQCGAWPMCVVEARGVVLNELTGGWASLRTRGLVR